MTSAQRFQDAVLALHQGGGKEDVGNHAVEALSILIPGSTHNAQELCRDGRILGPGRYPPTYFARFQSIEQAWEAWRANYHEHPIASRVWKTGKPLLASISDLLTVRQYHSLGIYQQVYKLFPIEDQLMLAWLTPEGGVQAFGVGRDRRGFRRTEKDALAALRPHLELAYRNAERSSQQLRASQYPLDQTREAAARSGLSPRQAEVLIAVLTAPKVSVAAISLGVSVLTVKKHLENIYRTLGVGSKTEALTTLLTRLERDSPDEFKVFWPVDSFID